MYIILEVQGTHDIKKMHLFSYKLIDTETSKLD